MRRIEPWSVWIGHVGDARDVRAVSRAGIVAVIDLAVDEAPIAFAREVVCCRFPLTDGGGNARWVVRGAVETVAGLLRARAPTLVYCGAGMSRSPAVVAGAIAVVSGRGAEACLAEVIRGAAADVSGGVWREVVEVVG